MIRYRVRKAIELRDSATGGTVTASGVRIYTSGALKRLDKGDGLVVLIDDGSGSGECEEIRISSGIYLEAGCEVAEYSPQSADVHTIWLLPAPGYPVPVGLAAVKGRTAPGAGIDIADEKNREPLKLTHSYDPSQDTIRLYHDRGIAPMGRWYMAVCGDISCACLIGEMVDKTADYAEYQVREFTNGGKLEPAGTVFYPMVRTHADDKGDYLAVLPFVTAADTELVLKWRGDEGAEDADGKKGSAQKGKKAKRKNRQVTISVSPGDLLRIDEEEN